MLHTPLRIVRIPHFGNVKADVGLEYVTFAEEYAAYMRGEAVSSHIIEYVAPEAICPITDESLTIICKDGELIVDSKKFLRRHYQFFDDYLSEFLDESSVTVPYSKEEVSNTLYGGLLTECYECLCYFNPKDTIYYFEHSTKGMSPVILLRLTENLTYKNRRDILEARRFYPIRSHPLPEEGLGLGILAHILEVHHDWDSLLHFFSNYPSYLTLACPYREEARKLLLVGGYHDGEYWNCNGEVCTLILLKIRETIDEFIRPNDEGVKIIGRVFAMLGIVDPIFKNEGTDASLPYQLKNELLLLTCSRCSMIFLCLEAANSVIKNFDYRKARKLVEDRLLLIEKK